MDIKVNLASQIITHDIICKTGFRQCSCAIAAMIRAKDLAECQASPAPPSRFEEYKAEQVERAKDATITQGLEARSIPEDLIRKRRIYLENVGISLVRKRLLDLSPAAQFEKIHELDRATKDEAYLTIRKSKDSIQNSINSLRAILQGVTREENEIRSREAEIERMLQERKDKAYTPKTTVSTGDATKKRATKKTPQEQVASLGIDVTALLSGFNAEQALARIKEKTKDDGGDKK